MPTGRIAVCALAVLGCLGVASAQNLASPAGLEGFVTLDRLPQPEDPLLAQGRAIWGDNCLNCHGGNKATGAPKITSTKAWGPRVDKGLDVLLGHALNGFIGPRFTEMPPRGANPELSDTDVALAMTFMVWASGGSEAATDFLTTLEGTN